MFDDNDITRDEFINDLLVFCKGWVGEVIAPILARVDELYDNAFVVAAVHEYADEKRRYDEHREYAMRRFIDDPEFWTVDDLDDEYQSRRVHYYHELLHTLLT